MTRVVIKSSASRPASGERLNVRWNRRFRWSDSQNLPVRQLSRRSLPLTRGVTATSADPPVCSVPLSVKLSRQFKWNAVSLSRNGRSDVRRHRLPRSSRRSGRSAVMRCQRLGLRSSAMSRRQTRLRRRRNVKSKKRIALARMPMTRSVQRRRAGAGESGKVKGERSKLKAKGARLLLCPGFL